MSALIYRLVADVGGSCGSAMSLIGAYIDARAAATARPNTIIRIRRDDAGGELGRVRFSSRGLEVWLK